MTEFSTEFREGMAATPHRQRILGDSDESSPDNWRWGGPGTPEPHVLLMLYARNEIALSELLSEQQSRFATAGLTPLAQLETTWLPQEKEHFGFRDGLSTTGIEGFHNNTRRPTRSRPASSSSGIPTRTGSTRSGRS